MRNVQVEPKTPELHLHLAGEQGHFPLCSLLDTDHFELKAQFQKEFSPSIPTVEPCQTAVQVRGRVEKTDLKFGRHEASGCSFLLRLDPQVERAS